MIFRVIDGPYRRSPDGDGPDAYGKEQSMTATPPIVDRETST
jgi:hypothetical protein